MRHLLNITIAEYFALEDKSEYDVFADILRPVNIFGGNRCHPSHFTFDEVEVFRKIYNDPTYEQIKDLFIHCFDLRGDMSVSSEVQFLSESVFVFFRANLFMRKHLIALSDRERKLLLGEEDVKMKMIGGYKILAPVSHLLTKMDLAEKFGTTPDVIGGWKYSKVFTILVAQSRRAYTFKEYQQIT